MFGWSRWNPFEEMFTFQREIDRLFNQFWGDLPNRLAAAAPGSFQVNSTDDGWRIDVPLPGIDPAHVSLEVAGNAISVRAEVPSDDKNTQPTRYEQTLAVPAFLELDKLTATYKHGMLQLSLPLKESVKPRRIQIEGASDRKQLSAA